MVVWMVLAARAIACMRSDPRPSASGVMNTRHRPLVDGLDADERGPLRDPAERRHEHLTGPGVRRRPRRAALTEDVGEGAEQEDAEPGVDVLAGGAGGEAVGEAGDVLGDGLPGGVGDGEAAAAREWKSSS
jgi:hypothetical protein